MRFTDQVAVVTGASDGIGQATAAILAGEGATVIAVARDSARLQTLSQKIGVVSGVVVPMAGDATLGAVADEIADMVVGRFGRIDILVNCVGGSTVATRSTASIDELSHADWQRLLTFNLDPIFLFTRAVVPVMKRARRGRIVNVSSLVGHGRGAMTSTAYVAAKGAVIPLTLRLAHELAPWGINVNATAPGLTMTPRMVKASADWKDDQMKAVLARIPLGRASTPEEQARVICFLASADAAYVTGVTIDVTGGA